MRVILAILTAALAILIVSGCQSLDSGAGGQEEGRIIYQPPVRAGETGRIVRLPTARSGLKCGPVSPSYHLIFERSGSAHVNMIAGSFSYEFDDQLPVREGDLGVPPTNQNVFNYLHLIDESWSNLASVGWGLQNYAKTHRQFRKYSFDEIRCWSQLEDQVAQYVLASFYTIVESDLQQGFRPPDSDALEWPSSAIQARDLSIQLLKQSGAEPRTTESCDMFPKSCTSRLTRPFPEGYPHANWLLMRMAERNPELVNDRIVEDPIYYFEQSLAGGFAPAFDRKFNVRRIELD